MVHKFGEGEVGTTYSTVNQLGVINFPSSPINIEVISDDANDTLLGDGARRIRIEGLDNNLKECCEDINMNGTTATTQSTNTYYRVFRAYVLETGIYTGSNFGDITIRGSGGGDNYLIITGNGTKNTSNYGSAQTQTTLFSVALGTYGILKTFSINVSNGKTADIIMYKRCELHNSSNPTPRRVLYKLSGISGVYTQEFKSETEIEGGCDIWVEAKVNSGTAIIDVNYDLDLKRNKLIGYSLI